MSYKRTEQELNEKLVSQFKFISSSSKSYDNGFEDEAQRIATALRILFHDTKHSKSLLTSLNIKDDVFIISSTCQYMPTNIVTYNGLVALKSTHDVGGEYEPLCRSEDRMPNEWYKAIDWWNEIVIDDKKNIFSRRDIICTVADQDGGAHVDDLLNSEYTDLIKNNSLGWQYSSANIPASPFGNNPAFASIRQIAQEILFSFQIRKQIKNYVRSLSKSTATVAFIGEKRYFYDRIPDMLDIMMPLFKDKRVERTELRHICEEKAVIDNGKKIERRLYL